METDREGSSFGWLQEICCPYDTSVILLSYYVHKTHTVPETCDDLRHTLCWITARYMVVVSIKPCPQAAQGHISIFLHLCKAVLYTLKT